MCRYDLCASAASPVAIRRRTGTTFPARRILPIRTATARTSRRVVVVVEPAALCLIPESVARMPVAVVRVEVVTAVDDGEFMARIAVTVIAIVRRGAGAAAPAGRIFPVRAWTAGSAGRIVIGIMRAGSGFACEGERERHGERGQQHGF